MRIALVLVSVGVAAFLIWWLAGDDNLRAVERADREAEQIKPGAGKRGASQASEAEASARETDTKEPEEQKAPVTIRGRVVADGQPVEHAFVYVVSDGDIGETVDSTSADGTFELTSTGRVVVGAAHEKYGPAQKEVLARAGEVAEVEIALPAGEVVQLVVLDKAKGQPVADAKVLVMRAGAETGLEGANVALESVFDEVEGPEDFDFRILGQLDLNDLMSLGSSRGAVRVPMRQTDGAGRIRITGLPKGTFDAIVLHDGFVPARLRREPIQSERDVEVRLQSGGGLTVIAPLVEGRAAEGYLCVLQRGGLLAMMPAAMKKIDAEGRAVFEHLAAGVYKVTVGDSAGMFGFVFGGMVVVRGKAPPDEAAAEPQEETLAEILLERGDGLADGGLRLVEPRRGPRKAPRARHRPKRGQALRIDRHTHIL